MTGRWCVRSRRTSHTWDLDQMTYTRHPGAQSQAFAYDDEPQPITRVTAWPRVGEVSCVWFDDPQDGLVEQYRVSSTIQSITTLPALDSEGRDVLRGDANGTVGGRF
jgi:hypothetical protein